MGLHQASFRLRHECPYRELSERYPDLTIREWYLNDCQVLEITSREAPQDELLDDVEELGTVLHKNLNTSGLHVVMQSCECGLEDSIIERFEDHECLYQPPTVHQQGWEHYTVIAFEESNIRELHEELDADHDIEVLSKTASEEMQIPHSLLTSVDQLFDGLTERQLTALRVALDNGYYEQPRRSSVSDLSDQTDVARSTFEEHLRKAQNKLLTNIGQFLRLVETQKEDALGVKPSNTSQTAQSD